MMNNIEPRIIIENWDEWSEEDHGEYIYRYLLHPWKNGWYEVCRYYFRNGGEIENILSSMENFFEGISLEDGKKIWNGDKKSAYLKLSFQCAQVLANKKSILTNDLDNDIEQELKKIAQELDLPFSMARDFAYYLLDSSISLEHQPLRCGVSFVADDFDGKMAILEIQIIPNDQGGRIYPHWDLTMIILDEDFGQQIERAQQLVEQKYGWPKAYDIRWNIIWEQRRHKPTHLIGPSLGLPFAYLFKKAVENL